MRVAREGRVAKHLPDLFGQSDFRCNDLLSWCSPLVPLPDISASLFGLAGNGPCRRIAQRIGYGRRPRLHVGWDYSTEGRTPPG